MLTDTSYTIYTVCHFDLHYAVYFTFSWCYTLRGNNRASLYSEQSQLHTQLSFLGSYFSKKNSLIISPIQPAAQKEQKQRSLKYERQTCFWVSIQCVDILWGNWCQKTNKHSVICTIYVWGCVGVNNKKTNVCTQSYFRTHCHSHSVLFHSTVTISRMSAC